MLVNTKQVVLPPFTMIRLPETRQSPSTILLEREVDSTEGILRNTLANVTKVSGFSDEVYIRNFIASLKTKTKDYEVANHALVTGRRHTAHIHKADQLVESGLEIVHRESYQAFKLLNSRLVTLGYKRCSSLNISYTSEHKLAQDNNNPEKIQGDTMGDHSGCLAGADLAGRTAKQPKTHQEQLKQLINFNVSRSVTRQIIDDFEPETVKPTTFKLTWRYNFTGVNVDSRSMKLPETYQ